ncbi:MAG TPA: T9SS type A sorting domain-containing protein, partial [Rhodothermales bacterium]|nr:T9SS type A sorting domain-containing protein [Rhodothermales bacterium]
STTLSWYLTGSAAGITSYEIELTRLGEGGATTSYSVTAPASGKSVSGPVGGASYSWKVKSCVGATCSAFSAPSAFTVHASVGGGVATVMPFAESPALGVVLTGASKPVLSWSLPVAAGSSLTYDVEVSRSADMAAPQRFERITAPYVALNALPAGTHYWRVRSRDAQGNASAYSPVETFVTTTSVAAEETAALPVAFALEAVYPNPLTRTGTVRFGLPEASRVHVALYDALGREVAVLVEGDLPAGTHRQTLDASGLAPGVYLLRMTTGRFIETRPLIVRR